MSNQEQIKRWERKGRVYGESVPEYLQKVWQNEGKGNEQEQNEEGLAPGHAVMRFPQGF